MKNTEEYREWKSNLSDIEKETIKKYTSEGSKDINGSLLKKLNSCKEEIEILDNALKKFKLLRDMTLYRAEGRDSRVIPIDVQKKAYDLMGYIAYPNYISTSTVEESAWNHLNYLKEEPNNDFDSFIFIEGESKKGTSCIVIDEDLTEIEEENEIILIRGLRLNIIESTLTEENLIEIKGEFV